MTLSTTAKDYIANHFGSGTPRCFASSGIRYTDPAGKSTSGSTQDVVSTLKVDAGGNARGPGGETYQNVVSANGGSFLTNSDVSWIGSSSYCVSTTPTPTPTPSPSPSTSLTWVRDHYDSSKNRYIENQESSQAIDDVVHGKITQEQLDAVIDARDRHTLLPAYDTTPTPSPSPGGKPVTGPLEVYVGGGGGSCSPGSPNVTIDTSEAYAFFKDTPYEYIGVGGIMVHNLSNECKAYFAWEAKIWDGYGYTTCPSTSPIHQEINRFLAEAGERPLSLKKLGASATEVVWGSFETLPTMEGEYTLCLSLWGNYDYEALIAELNDAGYYDKS